MAIEEFWRLNKERLIAEREYLRKIPVRLGKTENECVVFERNVRKNSIYIEDYEMAGKNIRRIKEELKKFLYIKLGIPIYIKKVMRIANDLVTELRSLENKLEILKEG